MSEAQLWAVILVGSVLGVGWPLFAGIASIVGSWRLYGIVFLFILAVVFRVVRSVREFLFGV